ncbi:MAG: TlpA disulfide reductase family protein [Bryobacteraceae bacterium]|jgi:cytochrome c biogenesis protein CcmG/thiol:disulfide interchange protein DsbE
MRTPLPRIVFFALGSVAVTAGQPVVRAALQPARDRKPAPAFALKDSSGKTVTLNDFRGKVVLLDFWATWCHGCKLEIPWFSEFEQKHHAKGLAVVGVSMDEGGWSVVKPFLAETHVPYRMLLGDDATAKRYGIGSLPDTFLIDRDGRLAAAYKEGLVDKGDVDANIQAILSEH